MSHFTQLDGGKKKQKQRQNKTKQRKKETACFQLSPSPVINAIKIQFEIYIGKYEITMSM